ncbi:hypothetical protein KDM41_17970, partial [bacterium]|nr:hypothetical protein [bacterium]
MRRPITILTGLILLLAAATAFADGFAVPDDARRLLPGETTAVVAVASLDEVLDEIVTLAHRFDPDSDVQRDSILADMGDDFATLAELVDPRRPLFLAGSLADPMAGTEPPLVFVLPKAAGADLAKLPAAATRHGPALTEGGYFAISSIPGYVPGPAASDLAAHLPAGVVSVSLDLGTVVTDYGAFLEMGLAGIPTRPNGTPPNDTGAMTEDEAAAMAEALRAIAASVERLDLALGRRDNLFTSHLGLGVKPGSALDAGPQPAFATALDLTGALPADATLWQVVALDQTRIFASFRDYYLVSLGQSLGGLSGPQREAYEAWVADYLDAMDLWARPLAAGLTPDGESMLSHAVMAHDDPAAALDRLAALIDGLGSLDIGYQLTPRDPSELAGVPFRSWDIAFDLARFEAAMPDAGNPAMTGAARMQAEQLVSIMRKVVPRIQLGAGRDHLYFAATTDTDDLAKMVRRIEKGDFGRPRADVSRVAAAAGPACRQVVVGDLHGLMQWVTDIMSEIDADEKATLLAHPIPFE